MPFNYVAGKLDNSIGATLSGNGYYLAAHSRPFVS